MTTLDDQPITTTARVRERRPLPEFPGSVLMPARARWRHRIRSVVVCGAAIAAVGGGVMIARRVAADDTTALRTATASVQTISEHHRAVAAIEPVTRAQVAFPLAGTVQSVEVSVGDSVAIGDTLATVDTTELEQSLRQAISTLTSAELTLNIALSGEDPSSTGGAPMAVGASTQGEVKFAFASASTDAYHFALVGVSDEVAVARQAVVDAQSAVTAARNAAAAASDAAATICGALNVTIDPNDPAGSISTIGSSLGACQEALAASMAALNAVAIAQSQLGTAANTLDALLSNWAAEIEAGAATTTSEPDEPQPTTTTSTSVPGSSEVTTTTSATNQPITTTPSDLTPATTQPGDLEGFPQGGGLGSPPAGGGAVGGGAVGGGSGNAVEEREPTAAELIAYQSAYDAAMHSVEAANQAIAQAALVSPIEGTVVAVELAPGDSVTAASDTQTIVVQGAGGYEATLSVSVDDISRITVGQPAELVPDGGDATVSGQVVAISQVPDSSGTTANYRVIVGLEGGVAQLRDGNIGDIAITVDNRDDVVAVPTSAITPTATGYTVQVVGATGEAETVQVDIGAVGPEWTEVRRGIDIGATVVVSDLDQPLPGTATDTSNAGSTAVDSGFPGGAGGGFPVGVFPGG